MRLDDLSQMLIPFRPRESDLVWARFGHVDHFGPLLLVCDARPGIAAHHHNSHFIRPAENELQNVGESVLLAARSESAL